MQSDFQQVMSPHKQPPPQTLRTMKAIFPTAICLPLETTPPNLREYLENARTGLTIVREKDLGHLHDVYDGAPCRWSVEQGATHTLYTGEGPGRGTRPARLLATVLYLGIDEDDRGEIVWEKWNVRTYIRREQGV